MTSKDLCIKYDKTIVTIYRWIEKGMPHKKVRNGLRDTYEFDEKEVDEWLDQQK